MGAGHVPLWISPAASSCLPHLKITGNGVS
jgi:hypothetical protein